MASSLCFWSILTLDNELKFLHVSQKMESTFLSNTCITMSKTLINHSLFDFIHPDETTLARRDISLFLKQSGLAGSVTRCQFKRLNAPKEISYDMVETRLLPRPNKTATQCQNHLIPGNQNNWEVMDIVLYTVTDNTLLAFFHSAEKNQLDSTNGYRLKNLLLASGVTCDVSAQETFTQQDSENLRRILNTAERPPNIRGPMSYRIFTVSDRASATSLLTWTSSDLINTVPLDEIQQISRSFHLKEYKGMAFKKEQQQIRRTALNDETHCTRHFYVKNPVHFLHAECNFERLSIPYGNVVFESIQISCISTAPDRDSLYHLQASPIMTDSLSSRSTSPTGTVVEPLSSLYSQDRPILPYFVHQEKKSECHVAGTTLTTELIGVSLNDNTDYATKQLLAYATPQNKSMPALFQKFRIYSNSPIRSFNQEVEFRQYLMDKKHKNLTRKYNRQPEDGMMPSSVKMCVRCHTNNSPEWRRGPDGNKTLCNACGLRYSRYKSKQWKVIEHFNKL